jgi:hypothetical protein
VISRQILAALVLALPVLVVTFAVLAGASMLAAGMGDATGARALQWIAVGTLTGLTIDALLLLAALGIRAVEEEDNRREN